MEYSKILIDTSIIIDFLRKERKDKAVLWSLRQQYVCAMSSVTLFELLVGAKTVQHREAITKLCRWIDILSFDEYSARISGEIYIALKNQNNLIEFRDIFIAATAKLECIRFRKKPAKRAASVVVGIAEFGN
jgi:predicted nucleic acid-binding protein